MDLKLQDKIALVTGSGSPIGYGRAIALTLAEEGCDVVCADLNLEWAEETARDGRRSGSSGAGGQGERGRSRRGGRHGGGGRRSASAA